MDVYFSRSVNTVDRFVTTEKRGSWQNEFTLTTDFEEILERVAANTATNARRISREMGASDCSEYSTSNNDTNIIHNESMHYY